MAKKTKAAADRIEVMQKLDNRMVPTRRRKEPTDWAIKGELFMNCSCTVFCPCVISLGKHPPTEGYCVTWFGIIIDEGHYEGEDLSGLNVGMLMEIPGRMAEGGWKAAVYVDERATQKAYNGILKILSGAAGGTTGVFLYLLSDIIHAEREKVLIERDGPRRRILVGDRKIQGEIELIQGVTPDEPVAIHNSKYWMGPTVYVAQGIKSRAMDHGRVWDFSGKSADITPINWKGSAKR